MKFSLVVAFVLLAATSAHAELREPAPPPQDPSVATIRGDVQTGTFGNTSTRVIAIDGELIYGPEESCQRHDLAPGPHSLVIEYENHLLPLRLDAAAGDAYVIGWQEGDGDFVLVKEMNSGKTVATYSDDVENRTPVYNEPASSAEGATIVAKPKIAHDWLIGDYEEGDVEIDAVDGKFLGPNVHSVRVSPGTRALTLWFQFSVGLDGNYQPIYASALFPFLIDVVPGTTYVVQHEAPVLSGRHTAIMSAWIVDSRDNLVVPKTRIATNVRGYYGGVTYDERVTFTDKKAKRPPPKPKLWCERDD